MPPQQPQGLLDFIHNGRNFGAHDLTGLREDTVADVAIRLALRNRAGSGFTRYHRARSLDLDIIPA
jgi:hypothetical protein